MIIHGRATQYLFRIPAEVLAEKVFQYTSVDRIVGTDDFLGTHAIALFALRKQLFENILSLPGSYAELLVLACLVLLALAAGYSRFPLRDKHSKLKKHSLVVLVVASVFGIWDLVLDFCVSLDLGVFLFTLAFFTGAWNFYVVTRVDVPSDVLHGALPIIVACGCLVAIYIVALANSPNSSATICCIGFAAFWAFMGVSGWWFFREASSQ